MPPGVATQNFGVVVSEEATGKVLHYTEKPESFVNDKINCGVYLFSLEIFNLMKAIAESKQGKPAVDIYGNGSER